MDAFALLGLPRELVVSDDDLRAAFRDAGKSAHPDAGGADGAFTKVQQAYAILASPAKRVQHWLQLHGAASDERGTIGAGLMDLFGSVGAALQRADALIRKREDARSSLARAMMEGETQACREMIEEGISEVEAELSQELSRFPAIQSGEMDVSQAGQTARNLVFLEKWRANLQERFAGLI